MFFAQIDVLCALSEYGPTAKWNLFVLYNNQDIPTQFVSEHRVDWAELNWLNWTFQRTFRLLHTCSCDPLKNFTNNIYSKLTFVPGGNPYPKILQHVSRFTAICDRSLAITGCLSKTYLDKYFLPFHIRTKLWLFCPCWGHWQRSLSNFSSDSFTFLWKFAYVCLENFVDQLLWLDSSLWSRAPVTPFKIYKIADWTLENRMELNASKTKSLLVTGKRPEKKTPDKILKISCKEDHAMISSIVNNKVNP